MTVAFELDGRALDARPGESILEAAQRHGIEIPRLCHRPGLRPDGNCRACVVEIDGERTLAASCCRAPVAGMRVRAQSDRARHSQKMVVELLLSDAPAGYERTSPLLGEHNEWVLGEILELDSAEQARLRDAGALE